MGKPGPESVEAIVERAVQEMELEGSRLLVAVSGGVDSIVLLDALDGLSQQCALDIVVGHVNHQLRGEESRADEKWLCEEAARRHLEIRVAQAEARGLREGGSKRERPTLQEAARRVRYEALRTIAEESGADAIATAHNANDQLETVLLRLLRGCGPEGLAGIAARSRDGRVVRPLLAASREAVLAHAKTRGLVWREDSSNEGRGYARNRLRHDWIPGLMREFNPQLLRAVTQLADAQRSELEWLEDLVEQESRKRFEVRDRGLWIRAGGWDDLPEALARRLVRTALGQVGSIRDVSRAHVERALAFLREGRVSTTLELPGGVRLTRHAAGFLLESGSE